MLREQLRWLFFLFISPCFALTTVNVTSSASSGAGTLHEAIFTIMFAGDSANEITFNPGISITLTTPLPPIYLADPSHTLTVNGNADNSTTINGNSLYRAFFIQQGTVSFDNITCQNLLAKGGDGGGISTSYGSGGGGGLGAGGAFFIGDNASVTITNISFAAAAAEGGAGGSTLSTTTVTNGGCGGGGLHGSGGASNNASRGGCGGGGYFGNANDLTDRSPTGGGGMFGNGGTSGLNASPDAGGSGGGGVEIGQDGSPNSASTGGAGGDGGLGSGGGSGGGIATDGTAGATFVAGGGGGGGGGSSAIGIGVAGDGGAGGFGGGGGAGGQMFQFSEPGINRKGSGGNGGFFGGGGGAGGWGGGGLVSDAGIGGTGGDYGGGGGSSPYASQGVGQPGGAGGFGGGGGGAGSTSDASGQSGGAGGFGAGGGGGSRSSAANSNSGGAGGLGAGSGGTGTLDQAGSGGGGGALGGAIFVRDGGTLNFDIDLPNGSLTAGSAGTAGSGSQGQDGETAGTSIFINGNTTISVGGATGTRTISGTIEDDQALSLGSGTKGNGGLTKVGANTVVLAAANTYTGSTIVTAGTLSLGAGGSLSDSSSLNVTGTFDISAASGNRSIASLEGSGGVVLGANTLSTVGNASTEYAGVISGTGGFTKSGTGTLSISGVNSYSGTTTVSGGTLSGNTTSLQGGSSRSIVNNATLVFDQGSLGSYNGTITQTGTGSLVKQNTGTLNFTGDFTQDSVSVNDGILNLSGTGIVSTATIVAGTLSLSTAGTLNTGAAVNVMGAFDISSASGNRSIASLEGSGTVTLGSNTLSTVGNASTTFSGSISGSGGLTKSGSGILTLSGSNDYTGTTTISAGTLALDTAGDLSNSTAVNVTGALDISAASGNRSIASIEGAGTVSLGANTLSTVGNASTTFSGGISGSGGLTKSGTGTLTLSGSNDYTGTTTINAGTLALDTAGDLSNSTALNITGTFDISAAGGDRSVASIEGSGNTSLGANTLSTVGNASAEYAGVISGTGGLTKSGSGILSISGANSYSGTTTVSGGTLSGNTTSLQGSSSRSIVNNATLIFDQGSVGTYNGTITQSGTGSLVKQNTGTLNFTGDFTQNSVTVNDGIFNLSGTGTVGTATISAGTLALDSAGTLQNTTAVNVTGTFDISSADADRSIASIEGPGGVTLGANTLSTVGNASTEYAGVISGTGGLTKSGTGTLSISGANSYSGTTTVSQGTLSGNTTSLQGDSSRSIINNAGLVFDQGSDGSYNGTITGTGTLTKQNSGSLNLTGSFTQTTLNVIGGTLAVNATGTVTTTTVSSGATLKGVGSLGSLGGSTTVSGTMAPGNSIGTTTILGDFTQASGSSLEVELNPSVSDLLQVFGNYQIDSGATLSILPEFGTYSGNTQYTLVQTSGVVSGTFTTVTSLLPSLDFEIFYLADEIRLLLNMVPFSNLPITGNAAIAAACLDTVDPVEGSDLDNVINELRFMSIQEQQQTLDQMQPSLFNAIDLVSQETLLNVENIFTPTEEGSQKCPEKTERVFWMDYYANQSDQKNEESQKGYLNTTQAGIFGANWYFISGNQARMLIGYTNDDLVWKERYGKNRTDSLIGAFEASFNKEWFYTAASLLGAFQRFDGVRNIYFQGNLFTSSLRKAKHTSYGCSMLGSWEFGMKLRKSDTTFYPYEKISYVYNYRESFTESGASSINLSVDAHHADLLRSETGLKWVRQFYTQEADKCLQKKNGSIYVKLAALWEGRFLGRKSVAQYTSVDCTMNVTGLNPNRWMGMASFGGSVERGPITFSLEGEGVWSENYSSYLGQGKIQIKF